MSSEGSDVLLVFSNEVDGRSFRRLGGDHGVLSGIQPRNISPRAGAPLQVPEVEHVSRQVGNRPILQEALIPVVFNRIPKMNAYDVGLGSGQA